MFDALNLPFDLTLLPQLDLLASLLLLVVLWIARKIVVGTIRARTELPPHDQRRLIATSRNVFLFLLLVGLVLIWAPQLRTFALSLTAVAVAIVVATKELILCLSGALLRATTRAFGIGDWIELGDNRGEVTDHTLLATTLQEFGTGPHVYTPTGRMIVLPNSMLLTTPVRNQSALREDTYHRFVVTLDPVPALEGKREIASDIVRRHYEPFRDRAARSSAVADRRTGPDLPDLIPAIRFRTSDLGKLRVEITLFCPSREAERLESDITWDLLAAFRPSGPKEATARKPQAEEAD